MWLTDLSTTVVITVVGGTPLQGWVGLVEPFKHFLHARAHLWFLVLELQVLIDTHLG